MAAYLCIASNGVPPSVSLRILLHVQCHDVQLDCQVESFPAAVHFWTRDGSEILGSGAKYITTSTDRGFHTKMVLTVRKLTQDDFGTYTCVARNLLGSAQGSIKLHDKSAPEDARALEDRTMFSSTKSTGTKQRQPQQQHTSTERIV
ncbi:hypothetical protein LAZ67_14003042 [Cordylochernes scorpioides]|uniref:Ig-like domain-containing protein n=1 Tax=Cordylochernes scorpioides TaxID=51811 RepID=A0ABY6L7E3_9ARAC|nr:hypothetical protein LAZ67_14003042 [Cordylochernes scorpioides]